MSDVSRNADPRKLWTPDELETALRLRARGVGYEFIARKLGRTPRGVEAVIIRREREKRANAPDYESARLEQDAVGGSRRLQDSIHRLFRRWEKEHGFQKGAGAILLPAGYNPQEIPKSATFVPVADETAEAA